MKLFRLFKCKKNDGARHAASKELSSHVAPRQKNGGAFCSAVRESGCGAPRAFRLRVIAAGLALVLSSLLGAGLSACNNTYVSPPPEPPNSELYPATTADGMPYPAAFDYHYTEDGTKELHDIGEGGKCTVCGRGYTKELIFTLNEDGASYAVSSSSGITINDVIAIPPTHEGLPVTRIAENAFLLDDLLLVSHITVVYIGKNVTEIGHNAFAGQYALNAIALPEEPVLQRIGVSAFELSRHSVFTPTDEMPYGVTRGFVIPTTVTEISAYAFRGRSDLPVHFGPENRFQKIGTGAFENASMASSELVLRATSPTLEEGALSGLSCAVRFAEDCPMTEIPDGFFPGAGIVFLSSRITRIGANNFTKANTCYIPEDSALVAVDESSLLLLRDLVEETLAKNNKGGATQ